MTPFERGFLIAVCVTVAALLIVAAYAFGVEDGARQAAPLCVGEDTVRVHRPTAPRGRVP